MQRKIDYGVKSMSKLPKPGPGEPIYMGGGLEGFIITLMWLTAGIWIVALILILKHGTS